MEKNVKLVKGSISYIWTEVFRRLLIRVIAPIFFLGGGGEEGVVSKYLKNVKDGLLKLKTRMYRMSKSTFDTFGFN